MKFSQFLEILKEWLADAWAIMNTPLFDLGHSHISLVKLAYFFMAFVILIFVSNKARKFLERRLSNNGLVTPSTGHTIGVISRFAIVLIGTMIIIQTAGIDLSALSLLAGALGVGIGFGLQNITDNLISGIIILFEKPIKVGDRIVVGDVEGDVINISFRATTVVTNDNISIIIPNSEFISSQVINWSHNDSNVRFRIPVGVSYNEDPAKIKKILLQAADHNPNILKHPVPMVLFDEYGDSSLNFMLAVWTATYANRPNQLRSDLYFDIFKRFKNEGVEIPFPQRDIHIKSGGNMPPR